MSDSRPSRYDLSEPYEICIKGHLDTRWADWFDGLAISHEDSGNTRLIGHITAQSALHGVLAKIRDLGLTLISLMPIASHQDSSHLEPHHQDSSHQKAPPQRTDRPEKTPHEHTSTPFPSSSDSSSSDSNASDPNDSDSSRPQSI